MVRAWTISMQQSIANTIKQYQRYSKIRSIKVNGGQELCMTDFQGQRASFATDVLPTWFLNFTAGKGQFDRLIYNQFVQVDGSSLDLLRSNSIGDAWPGYSRGFASCLQQSSRIYCTLSSKRPALSKTNKRSQVSFRILSGFHHSTIGG